MSHARLVQEWLEGWNAGAIEGRAAIRDLYAHAPERFPALRFELEDVIAHRTRACAADARAVG